MSRIGSCVEALAGQDCRPTFPAPGLIVERYPEFFRGLRDRGCEIAVHGYQHNDLGGLPIPKALEQLSRAVRAFERSGIEAHGFRCPYLGYSEELLNAIPEGLFEYGSNRSVLWDIPLIHDDGGRTLIAETLRSLYKPRSSREFISVPWSRPKNLEIPICVPDDLTLVDGYGYDVQGVAEAWCGILDSTHERGELFNLMFHPELADRCGSAFVEVIGRAKRKVPHVWIAKLGEISDWWREKAGFQTAIAPLAVGMRLAFRCTMRATILSKGLEPDASTKPWDGNYLHLTSRTLDVPASPRPFIGLSPGIPAETVRFLREQGYILDEGQTAPSCGIYLDRVRLSMLASETQLIDFIESCGGPLVRFGRWPEGAKSALAVTGDLDALSLADYFSRLHI